MKKFSSMLPKSFKRRATVIYLFLLHALEWLSFYLKRFVGKVPPFYCNVCCRPVFAFRPLPDYYRLMGGRFGWPYSESQAETCNASHYTCPWCQASDRDRLIAWCFSEHLTHVTPGTPFAMLDFAPAASLSRFFRRALSASSVNWTYRSADLFAHGVDDKVDIMDMSIYRDGQWDLFVCSHVLEHVPDDRRALAELRRVTRNNGRGFLLVPIVIGLTGIDEDPSVVDIGERWRRFGQDDHVRLYSREGFIERIQEAGFECQRFPDASLTATAMLDRLGLSPTSCLYVATPRPTSV